MLFQTLLIMQILMVTYNKIFQVCKCILAFNNKNRQEKPVFLGADSINLYTLFLFEAAHVYGIFDGI
jgi:hypothetical protein